MPDAADDTLLLAAREGDPHALDALLKQYQPHVYRFGMRMCGDPQAAQDVLQETLLAAARALRGFRGASSVSTWLYTIARSFCIKSRRRSVFAPEVVSLESQPAAARRAADTSPDPERQLADREIRSALESAIGALEPGHREVLVLRDVEGLPAAEVAEVTGLSVAAVKSRLHRARASVRERLAPLLAAAPGSPAGPAGSGVCPDVVGLLSRHLEGEIAPEACAEMERHVVGCPRCQGACDSLRQTLRLCGSAPLPEVPRELQESIREGIRGLLAERRP
ncbi:MAG TPA: sigma-70 family RNA polymerase sigma factor [Vicinamibacteria bacterium]